MRCARRRADVCGSPPGVDLAGDAPRGGAQLDERRIRVSKSRGREGDPGFVASAARRSCCRT
ncbi:MAG: hypothetical protein ACK52I_24930 [Pseudomonadota bacterium]